MKKQPKFNINSLSRSALRRVFVRGPLVQSCMRAARVEQPKHNKDGSVAKKPAVFYTCASCSGLFKQGDVAVDHIEPVVSPDTGFVDWNTFMERLWCTPNNLQVLCSTCHHSKSQEERKARDLRFS